MKGRKPGTLANFVCQVCEEEETVTGGTSYFVCSKCKPADHYTRGAQYQAHKAVARARRLGQLPDPATLDCVDCGGYAIEYDHRDYSKPLEVQPVCRRCNLKRGPAIGSPAYKAPATEGA
jgi:hypothetical protein